MRGFTRYWKKFVLALILAVLIPLILDVLVFSNAYPSKVSNDGWAGFLGGYIGAIIGAVTTLIAILLEQKYNQEQRAQDEIRTIRPYLCVQNYSQVTYEDRTIDLTLNIQNVGFHAACDIYLYDNDQDDSKRTTLYYNHLTLAANSEKTISVKINLYKSEFYEFVFYDIRGDKYAQELRIEGTYDSSPKRVASCNTLEPELISTKEEREGLWSVKTRK